MRRNSTFPLYTSTTTSPTVTSWRPALWAKLDVVSPLSSQMLHQLPRVERQLFHVAHADGQLANRPRVAQRHHRDRHSPQHAPRRRLRHDTDANVALDEPAHGVEAA